MINAEAQKGATGALESYDDQPTETTEAKKLQPLPDFIPFSDVHTPEAEDAEKTSSTEVYTKGASDTNKTTTIPEVVIPADQCDSEKNGQKTEPMEKIQSTNVSTSNNWNIKPAKSFQKLHYLLGRKIMYQHDTYFQVRPHHLPMVLSLGCLSCHNIYL